MIDDVLSFIAHYIIISPLIASNDLTIYLLFYNLQVITFHSFFLLYIIIFCYILIRD